MHPSDTLLLALFLAILLAAPAMSAAGGEGALREQLQKRVYSDEQGDKLPYRLFVPPGYDRQAQYPLILFLHGAGERGADNEAQLVHPEVLRFVGPEARKQQPCLLVAPQCPAPESEADAPRGDSRWTDVDWGATVPIRLTPEPAKPMRLVIALLEELEKEFNVDPSRRYVTGLSMGGYGTYDLLLRQPDRWAAAIAICGGGDVSKADRIAHIPLWIFHGTADGAVPVARSRAMVAALKEAGGSPRYTEYEGAGHNVWSRAYHEPELIDWLFSKQRPKAESADQ
jgi:predicted peptidase